jgi:hypothetical protein
MKFWHLLSLALASVLPVCVHSQERVPPERGRPWSVDGTFLGPAGLYSVGAYRDIPGLSGKWLTSSVGLSAGIFPWKRATSTTYVVLPELNYLFFSQVSHHVELGALARVEYEQNWDETGPDNNWFFFPTMRFGYRFEPPGGRMYVRTGISPYFIRSTEEEALLPLPYLGFGLNL